MNSREKIKFNIVKFNHKRFWKFDKRLKKKKFIIAINSFIWETYKIKVH